MVSVGCITCFCHGGDGLVIKNVGVYRLLMQYLLIIIFKLLLILIPIFFSLDILQAMLSCTCISTTTKQLHLSRM